jgi:DDE superfamily endonuclease
MPLVRGSRAFFPSAQRAQVTDLACTLPRDSGRPLSRWSSTELVAAAQARGIAASLSPSTIRCWLRAEKIKPWQYHSWQQPTDPRFLERTIPVLDLYERAQQLAAKGHVVVCADEKTSIQARQAEGTLRPTRPGRPLRIGDRYHRRGALQLFAALLVSTGETLARCFDRKRFVEFQTFLGTFFGSLWCRNIHRVHLILDNGSTHAPKQLPVWLRTLGLPFAVELHWLPVHASWLDQVELVFSTVQRKVLTPQPLPQPRRVGGDPADSLRRAKQASRAHPLELYFGNPPQAVRDPGPTSCSHRGLKPGTNLWFRVLRTDLRPFRRASGYVATESEDHVRHEAHQLTSELGRWGA